MPTLKTNQQSNETIRAGMTRRRNRSHKLVNFREMCRFVMLFMFPNDGSSGTC